MQPILEAKNLTKTFHMGPDQHYHALRGVDLAIYPGEFVAVMGPSGSGKSTLLYQVSGMDEPTDGCVHFSGIPLHSSSEQNLSDLRLHRMGFVFQQSHLLKDLSLLDNVVLPGFASKSASKGQVAKKARNLLAGLGIDHIADHRTSEASGGQLQRVSIARALINDPEILFGDEPTGSLNSGATDEVMRVFSDINGRGTTVMLVTHDARVAARAHRVLFMADGKILSEIHLGEEAEGQSPTEREAKLMTWLTEKGI
jgi:putative ABC transport system ATP-binding protein